MVCPFCNDEFETNLLIPDIDVREDGSILILLSCPDLGTNPPSCGNVLFHGESIHIDDLHKNDPD